MMPAQHNHLYDRRKPDVGAEDRGRVQKRLRRFRLKAGETFCYESSFTVSLRTGLPRCRQA